MGGMVRSRRHLRGVEQLTSIYRPVLAVGVDRKQLVQAGIYVQAVAVAARESRRVGTRPAVGPRERALQGRGLATASRSARKGSRVAEAADGAARWGAKRVGAGRFSSISQELQALSR